MAKVRGAIAAQEMRKQAGGGKFLTLKGGDSYEVAFAGVLANGLEGEPLGVEVVWIEGANGRYSVEYDANKHNQEDMRVSFLWNVLVRGDAEDGSGDEMKIFQQGPQFFDHFIKHKDKKGYDFWFTISRTGDGQFDTKYSLDCEDAIEPDEIEDIKKMDLHDLDKESSSGGRSEQREEPKKPKREGRRRRRAADAPSSAKASGESKSNGSNGSGSNGSNGDAHSLISDAQRDDLKGLLAGLPDPVRGQTLFSERFKIKKLRELSTAQFDEAKLFVEAMARGETESAEEVDDPFLD